MNLNEWAVGSQQRAVGGGQRAMRREPQCLPTADYGLPTTLR
jgi:hypothetical protein